MKWVVLSDLHMDFKNCTTKTARRELLKVLKKENEEEDISFILITGDCLHRNHGDVEKSRAFIQEIGKSCGIEKDRIIICPGNHDIDRDNAIRNAAIKNYREHGVLPEVENCLAGYVNFRELYSLVYSERYKPFFFKDVDDFRVIEIDSCLLSKDDKDYGNLIVGFSELADLSDQIPKDEKINIVMMHHGVEWLQADDGRRFQHWLVQNNVKMVFCGHNHAPGMNILTEAISENRLPMEGIPQFTCGCALADSYSNPVFMVGKYMKDGPLKIELYEYRNNSKWEKASGLLRSFPNGSYQASTLDGMIRNSYDIPKIYNTIYDMGNDVEKEIKTSSRLDFFGL